jgi:hypothetical protein
MNALWTPFVSYCKETLLLRRLFVSKDGRVVIAQWPNRPLWIAIGLGLVSVVTSGLTHRLVGFGEVLAFLYWAVLEVRTGESLFRKVLGGFVIIFSIGRLLN